MRATRGPQFLCQFLGVLAALAVASVVPIWTVTSGPSPTWMATNGSLLEVFRGLEWEVPRYRGNYGALLGPHRGNVATALVVAVLGVAAGQGYFLWATKISPPGTR